MKRLKIVVADDEAIIRLGLRTEGVVIKDPGCVAKSFPTFWQTLDTLHPTLESTV